MNEKDDVSRRDTLKLAITAIGGFIGAAFGIPAIAYIVGPAIKTNEIYELDTARFLIAN